MASTQLNAKISTTGAAKAQRELRDVSTQAKKTESNVINMGTSFKSASKNAAASAAAISGPMGGIASRIGAVTTVLTSGTAAATGLGLAITALGFSIAEGISELDSINVELAKTEAILKATGEASGKTSQQLLEQARSIGMATLASTQGIQQAQAKLLTFDKIHGQVFDDAIMLTQDLATVFGGDASSQATQLGKALQDPVAGLTALNRVGVSFTEQQQNQVKAMVASGKTMQAQAVIINALKNQVGGAGADVAKDSLAGKLDTAGQLWSEFSAKLATETGGWAIANKLVDGMVGRLGELNRALEPDSTTDLFEKRLKIIMQIANLEDRIAERGPSAARSQLEGQVRSLQSEADSLFKQISSRANAENEESLKAAQAHESSMLKIKNDAEILEQETQNAAIQKKISAELDFYDKRQEYLEKQRKDEAEANKQAYIDDEEMYGTFQQLKLEHDKRVAKEKLKQQRDGMDALGNVTSDLKVALGEQSALYKAAAITETTINTYKSATAAYSALAPIPYIGPALGAAAAGVAIGAGLANVAAIQSARYQGGQLSPGQTSSLAEQGDLEIITPSSSSRVKTKQQMQQIMGGSGGQTNMIVNVINQGTNTEVQTEQRDDGELVILIRDTVSADLGRGNSQISKALSANTSTTRRRA